MGGHYLKESDRKSAVLNACERGITPTVLSVLQEQNSRFGLHVSQQESLKKLESGGCVVVTGQQMGLFSGPAFTMYKLATTIALARSLEKETGKPVAPLFWLQSEDHDLEEVRMANILKRTGELQEYSSNSSSESLNAEDWRTPLASTFLNGEIETTRKALHEELDGYEFAGDMLQIIEDSYQEGVSYEAAFWKLMHNIWASEGVLFLSPRDPHFTIQTSSFYESAFKSYQPISEALQKTSHELEKNGFQSQVHIRADSPLFFYSPDGAAGPRYRLKENRDAFSLLGETRSVTRQELQDSIAQAPELFTTSALLRPLLQDSMLPTAAYIAGPSEFRYHAQITPLYEHYAIKRPLVVPRAQYCILEPRIQKLLSELQLKREQVFFPDQELLSLQHEKIGSDTPGPDELKEKATNLLHELFGSWEKSFQVVDETLLKPLRKSQENIEFTIQKLLEKYSQSLLKNDTIFSQRIERIRSSLKPDGVDQERIVSGIYFLSRYGENWKRAIIENVFPLEVVTKEIQV